MLWLACTGFSGSLTLPSLPFSIRAPTKNHPIGIISFVRWMISFGMVILRFVSTCWKISGASIYVCVALFLGLVCVSKIRLSSDWTFFVFAGQLLLCLPFHAHRSHLRAKYSIPEGGIRCVPDGYEDCCCSLVCPCLTAAQMLHHTADYDTHPAQWCSETGLSPTVPAIV